MAVKDPRRITLSTEVRYPRSWLSWVSAVTGCLNALGIECDLVDVAGMSGYAFAMSIHKALAPSGPTSIDWNSLLMGINMLGRSTEVFQSGECHCSWIERTEYTRAHCRAVYELVEREILCGRPVVIWGAYVPEFAIAYGIEDGKLLVKSVEGYWGRPEPPIFPEELEAPGGVYAIAFPTPTGIPGKKWVDYYAVCVGVESLLKRSANPFYRYGLEAYEAWITALEAGPDNPPCDKNSAFGNAYCAQCYAEAKKLGCEFLERISKRNKRLGAVLEGAVGAYRDVTQAMERVASVFSFPPKDEFYSESARKEGVEMLRIAYSAEKRASEVLRKASELEWEFS